jgi:glyoxylase-like metal-dependent hydrolase (beta-lactamase superfamily II)
MTRRSKVSFFALFAALFLSNSLSPRLRAQEAGVLTNLEIGSYKTPIEYLRFPLDQPVSTTAHEYTATVSDQYTAKFYVTATTSANTDEHIAINGNEVKSGEPYALDLPMGETKFVINITSSESPSNVYNLTVNRKDLSKAYTSESLGKGIWRVRDFGGTHGDETFYLIEGANRAMVFDVGMGKGDLPGYLRTLTKLPIAVAITHGHGDHFGQVDEFKDSDVYINEKDVTRLPHDFITSKFHYVKDGDMIDLGGRKFEAINIPGHTLGSTVYLDRADGLAITGDGVSSGSMVYMFGANCTALDEYVRSLKHLEARIADMPNLTLLVGHAYQERTPLNGKAGKQMITDMREAGEKVLAGQAEGRQVFNTQGGQRSELRELNNGLAGLWYNPKNIQTGPAALGMLDLKTQSGSFLIWKAVFSSFITNYNNVTMPDQSNIVVVTPTAYWPNYKKITVNGAEVKSGASQNVQLTAGTNKIAVEVTGNDGSIQTYTVQVQK